MYDIKFSIKICYVCDYFESKYNLFTLNTKWPMHMYCLHFAIDQGLYIVNIFFKQVANMVDIAAVVCLGFSVIDPIGCRGEAGDPILEQVVPTLFIVGQCASRCPLNELEELRVSMKAQTSLVVVGGADDCLRLCHARMKVSRITQSVADKAILVCHALTNFHQ